MDYGQKIDGLIEQVVIGNGSDLHLAVGRVPMVRITTQLLGIVKESELTEEDVMGVLTHMLANEEKLALFRENQEVDFAYDWRGEARLRGNAYFQKGKVAIALRLIPKVKTLEELALPPALRDFVRLRQGFFLIVGPVGQGKSTTMAALIDIINTERAEHIITIEEPIEYLFESKKSIIDQREVGIDTKDFATALKSAFREDANVLMIGEMRSRDTISAAVTAAETGHLVFSTLHTNNAPQTIDRIIDSYPPEQQDQARSQLANSLVGIFSQRLIPRTNGGLAPAYELLVNNKAVANLIRENRTHEIDLLIETGSENGMIDMNQSLLDLVRRGEITVDDARHHAFNKKAFDALL